MDVTNHPVLKYDSRALNIVTIIQSKLYKKYQCLELIGVYTVCLFKFVCVSCFIVIEQRVRKIRKEAPIRSEIFSSPGTLFRLQLEYRKPPLG